MIRKTLFTFVALAGLAAFSVVNTAGAKSGVKIGSLKCHVAGGTGAIIASSKDMTCRFYKANGKRERYEGTIRKIGFDIGVTDEATLVWLVFAPGRTNRGALRGTYVGASADAALGIGGGANVLIGGFNRSIVLQPVSLQVQTGINVSVGLAALELR